MSDTSDRRLLSRRSVIMGAAATATATAAGTLISAPAHAAQVVPAASAADADGILDWVSHVLDVATIAGQLLSQVLAVANGDAPKPPYRVGNLMYFPSLNADGSMQVQVTNVGTVDAGLLYSITQSEPSTNTSLYTTLLPGYGYNCSGDLANYVGGHACLAPVQDIVLADGTASRLMNFAVRGLWIGSVISVVGGLSVSVVKGADGAFIVHITTSNPPDPYHIDVSATGPNGSVVRAQWDRATQGPPVAGVIDIALPSGVSLDPLLQSLDMTLNLDPVGLDAATAAQRSRNFKI